ncbi:hypothetical protein AAFC00_003869 [Neodothiora populina]|uniref:histidine kinase n=1 Tax=Neodothiora populina TaxID=2781224 RepID=A0ABR3PFN8_9PEZI
MDGQEAGKLLDPELRKSICLAPAASPETVIHNGDQNFSRELNRLYTPQETQGLERLVQMKEKLRGVSTDDFWGICAEQLAESLGAQLSFIAKRILVDEQDAAVEMPPIGEPGSCLMAAAWYYNDGHGLAGAEKNMKYHAYGCPCGYMRHDKVFVVPEKVGEIFSKNPNNLPFAADSYIGIPLFFDNKCFAHFGIMWSLEGNRNRPFSWSYIELFMHAIEDMITERLLEGSGFITMNGVPRESNRIIPHEVVTAAQSLQPYAKSLSHELRTPMQGVVGMLDVMYATVQEAAEGQSDPTVRKIFESLKDNIEIVQDSSRRAVEAADNVVHAYDMNMGIPESSPLRHEESTDSDLPETFASHPEILVAGSNLPIQRPNKRRRDEDRILQEGYPRKLRATSATRSSKNELSETVEQDFQSIQNQPMIKPPPQRPPIASVASVHPGDRPVAPGVRHTNLRQVLQYVVNEGLKVGGRPESAIAKETQLGEVIEVCTYSASGEPRTKIIEWTVDPGVQETILVDEKDLAKLISCVFLNAIKFTDQGKVCMAAKMSPKGRYIVIRCTDTGPGIPAAFLPKLFQPFSQEDPSLTRQSEGLGLGLLVAKGLARKLGGDLFCIRTETEGPRQGSEFEMRIPVTPGEIVSRPVSPFSSPQTTRQRNSGSVDSDGRPSPTPVYPPTPTTSMIANTSASRRADIPAPQLDMDLKSRKQGEKRQSQSHSHFPVLPHSVAKANGNRKASATLNSIDRELALKYPLTFLVAEDNKINRKLLVSMLRKFGYKTIHEAYDGAEAVRQMAKHGHVDVVLMDLWMPFMDGYEATEKILSMEYGKNGVVNGKGGPTVLAVTADVTNAALERAAKVGMKGFMTKPFKLMDLQRLIQEYCAKTTSESVSLPREMGTGSNGVDVMHRATSAANGFTSAQPTTSEAAY